MSKLILILSKGFIMAERAIPKVYYFESSFDSIVVNNV